MHRRLPVSRRQGHLLADASFRENVHDLDVVYSHDFSGGFWAFRVGQCQCAQFERGLQECGGLHETVQVRKIGDSGMLKVSFKMRCEIRCKKRFEMRH